MASLNKVMLIGHVGQNPEVKASSSGSILTNISLATSKRWKDKKTGLQQEKTEWHRILLADRGAYKMGEIASSLIKKGSKIYVEGELETQKWQDKEGVDRWITKINASEFKMLDSKQDTANRLTQQNQLPQHTPTDNNLVSSPSIAVTEIDDGIPF